MKAVILFIFKGSKSTESGSLSNFIHTKKFAFVDEHNPEISMLYKILLNVS